jgi:hypothetical protein
MGRRAASDGECEEENNECDVICIAVTLPRAIMCSQSVSAEGCKCNIIFLPRHGPVSCVSYMSNKQLCVVTIVFYLRAVHQSEADSGERWKSRFTKRPSCKACKAVKEAILKRGLHGTGIQASLIG